MTTPNGEEVETSSEAQKTQDLVALAVSNPLVGEVLGRLAQPTLDWAVMWKIYEIIRSDVGGQEALFSAKLAEKTAVKAFTASANRPDVSGPSARHARLPGGRPRWAV